MRQRPTERLGLYDPAFEHDACGVTFVARLNGVPTHETVVRGLTALANLEHRGAANCPDCEYIPATIEAGRSRRRNHIDRDGLQHAA